MAKDIAQSYRQYIACLNRRDWDGLSNFVHHEVRHNGRPLGLSGYRDLLETDVRDIPDLRFEIGMLVASPPRVAACLMFDCTPTGGVHGTAGQWPKGRLRGSMLSMSIVTAKIWDVKSVIDKGSHRSTALRSVLIRRLRRIGRASLLDTHCVWP